MKEIIPHKIIISLDESGSFKDAIMQYRIKHGSATENKFYTMSIKNGISTAAINTQILKAKEHVEKGEGVRAND
jgi:hypothetical protein